MLDFITQSVHVFTLSQKTHKIPFNFWNNRTCLSIPSSVSVVPQRSHFIKVSIIHEHLAGLGAVVRRYDPRQF